MAVIVATGIHGEQVSGQAAVDHCRREAIAAREEWVEAVRAAIGQSPEVGLRYWDADREAHRLYERYRTVLMQYYDVSQAVGSC